MVSHREPSGLDGGHSRLARFLFRLQDGVESASVQLPSLIPIRSHASASACARALAAITPSLTTTSTSLAVSHGDATLQRFGQIERHNECLAFFFQDFPPK